MTDDANVADPPSQTCVVRCVCFSRLLDLLENHGLARDMKTLDSLVFDEADQLLEMGFRPAIENILRSLKPSKVMKGIWLTYAARDSHCETLWVQV